MGILFDRAKRQEREGVLLSGELFPADRPTQATDTCAVERFDTPGGGWNFCATHGAVYGPHFNCPRKGC